MFNWLAKLTNKHVTALTPYESARRLFAGKDGGNTRQTWLNANESPYSRAYQVDSSIFNRYPDCQPDELLQAYAQ